MFCKIWCRVRTLQLIISENYNKYIGQVNDVQTTEYQKHSPEALCKRSLTRVLCSRLPRYSRHLRLLHNCPNVILNCTSALLFHTYFSIYVRKFGYSILTSSWHFNNILLRAQVFMRRLNLLLFLNVFVFKINKYNKYSPARLLH